MSSYAFFVRLLSMIFVNDITNGDLSLLKCLTIISELVQDLSSLLIDLKC